MTTDAHDISVALAGTYGKGTVYLRTRPAPYGEITGNIALTSGWVHVTDSARDRSFPAGEVLAIEWAEGRDMSE